MREHQGEHQGSTGAQHGEPELADSYPLIPAQVDFIIILDTVARFQPLAAWIQFY